MDEENQLVRSAQGAQPISGSLEHKEEVERRSRETLESSGAYDCTRIIETEDPSWNIQENTNYNDKRIPDGMDLIMSALGGGTVDYYYGKGFLIRATVGGSILVLSGIQPVEIFPDSDEGWGEIEKEMVQSAILAAYQSPGAYEWFYGMGSEAWNLRLNFTVKRRRSDLLSANK